MITLREDHNSAPEKSAKDPYLPQTPEQIRDERMIASDNRYTHQRRAGSFCSRLVLCCLAVFWLIPPAGADSPATNDTDAIDICRYNSESLEDLRDLVKARALGKTLSELAHALSNDPDQLLAEWEKPEIKIDERLHNLGKIPFGHIYIHRVFCPQGFGNQNVWFFDIFENEDGIIRSAHTQLFYNDQNFAMRNESINANHYLSEDWVVKAVASMAEARLYNREQMREEMIAGGFWLNRSCITAGTVTDNFVIRPLSPDNMFVLISFYHIPDPPPHAAITFARPSEEFLNVKKDNNECSHDARTYGRQSSAFFLENYPESWIAKAIKYKREQKRQKKQRTSENVAFLRSLTPIRTVANSMLISLCGYDVENFDDLDALVQARGIGATLPELARVLSKDPADTLAYWEETNKPLSDQLRELSGVTTGRLYEIGQGCRQESGLIDVWWFRIIKNQDGVVAWIETTLRYDDHKNPKISDDLTGSPKPTSDPSTKAENDPVHETSADSIAGDLIDLCRYGSQSFDDLAALVKARGLGKKLVALAHALSEDPDQLLADWHQHNRPVDPEIQEVTGIIPGRLYRFVQHCPQAFDNYNIWSFHILENEGGRVKQIDPYLFYDRDQNFAMRNEAINAARYATPKGVVQAVTSLAEARSYSREDMRKTMNNGGFWLNGSCETIEILRDNFVAPYSSPNSLVGLHGYPSTPWDQYPHAAVVFSRSSGELMKVHTAPDVDHRECRLNNDTMEQQGREFFKKTYPDSWIVKKMVQ